MARTAPTQRTRHRPRGQAAQVASAKKTKAIFKDIQFTFITLLDKPTFQRGVVTLQPDGISIELLPDLTEELARYKLVAKRFGNRSYAGSGVASDGAAFRAHFAELGQG